MSESCVLFLLLTFSSHGRKWRKGEFLSSTVSKYPCARHLHAQEHAFRVSIVENVRLRYSFSRAKSNPKVWFWRALIQSVFATYEFKAQIFTICLLLHFKNHTHFKFKNSFLLVNKCLFKIQHVVGPVSGTGVFQKECALKKLIYWQKQKDKKHIDSE